MLVALGEAGVKTLEDFAGFVADEVISDHDAPLKSFDLTTEQADGMIMQARLKAGWITEADLAAAQEAREAAEAEAIAAPDDESGASDEEA